MLNYENVVFIKNMIYKELQILSTSFSCLLMEMQGLLLMILTMHFLRNPDKPCCFDSFNFLISGISILSNSSR